MHLFDSEGDIRQTQKQFWTAFICVAAATYLGAIVALSGVQQRKKLRLWLLKYTSKHGHNATKEADASSATPGRSSGTYKAKKDERTHSHVHAPLFFRRRWGVNDDPEKADKGKSPEVPR